MAHADYNPFIYTDIGVYFHLRPSTKDVAPLKTEVRTKGKLKLRDTKKKNGMGVWTLLFFLLSCGVQRTQQQPRGDDCLLIKMPSFDPVVV